MEDRQDAVTNREVLRTGLGQTTHTEEDQGMENITEVDQDMILIIGVATDIIGEVIKNMGDRIIITEGETLEIKIMIGIGVGHMKDRIGTEEMIETLVIVDQDQVQEQLQIGIGLNASNVGNMATSQETVLQLRQIERQNKFNRCSIWMRIKQY